MVTLLELFLWCQAAKTKQRIREENMQVTVIERSQQIQVQDQEITRRERELDAQVKKPAEAEKFRLEKLAEANRWVGRCELNALDKKMEDSKILSSRSIAVLSLDWALDLLLSWV